MLQLPHGTLARTFHISADESRYLKILQARFEEEMERRKRREELEEEQRREDEFFEYAMVTVAEISEFRNQLDLYDTAAVIALQENEIRLKDVQERLEKMFGEAHVLPDGRKVFKTNDGLRVFSAEGEELGLDTINPDDIDDKRPRWEAVKAAIDEREQLVKEREQLLEYQQRLDAAREKLDSGNLTRTEFDGLRNELKADMPEALRRHLPDAVQDAIPVAKATELADDLDLSDDIVPSRSGPRLG